MKSSTASISELLPAEDDDCSTTASGLPASARLRPDNLPSCWSPRPPRRIARSPTTPARTGADRATAPAPRPAPRPSSTLRPAEHQQLGDALPLQLRKRRPQLAHLTMDRLFLRGELVRRLLHERRPLPRQPPCPACRRDSRTRRARSSPDTFTLTRIRPRLVHLSKPQHAVHAPARCVAALRRRRSPPSAHSAQTAAWAAPLALRKERRGARHLQLKKKLSPVLAGSGSAWLGYLGTILFSLAAAFTAAGCGSMLGAGVGSSIIFSLAVLLVSAGSGSTAGAAALARQRRPRSPARRAARWPLALCPSTPRRSTARPAPSPLAASHARTRSRPWPLGNCTRKHSMPIPISSSASFAAALSPASSRS